MKIMKTATAIALGISMLSACGDDPASTEITTESVSAFDPDNPCDGNAVRLTITRSGEEPVVEYLCQGLDDHVVPEIPDFVVSQLGVQRTEVDFECNCSETPPSQEECDAAHRQLDVMETYLSRCTNEAVILLGEAPPPGVYEFFECMTSANLDYLVCLDNVDFETCEGLTEASDCVATIPSNMACAEILTDDADASAWIDLYVEILQQLSCELF